MKAAIKDIHCPDVADLARWVPSTQAEVGAVLRIEQP
jgi:hypothetical protein